MFVHDKKWRDSDGYVCFAQRKSTHTLLFMHRLSVFQMHEQQRNNIYSNFKTAQETTNVRLHFQTCDCIWQTLVHVLSTSSTFTIRSYFKRFVPSYSSAWPHFVCIDLWMLLLTFEKSVCWTQFVAYASEKGFWFYKARSILVFWSVYRLALCRALFHLVVGSLSSASCFCRMRVFRSKTVSQGMNKTKRSLTSRGCCEEGVGDLEVKKVGGLRADGPGFVCN